MFECSCSRCLSPLEEDGLMLSLQCSDFSCSGAVPRDLLSNIFRKFQLSSVLLLEHEVVRLHSLFQDPHSYLSEHVQIHTGQL